MRGLFADLVSMEATLFRVKRSGGELLARGCEYDPIFLGCLREALLEGVLLELRGKSLFGSPGRISSDPSDMTTARSPTI
jgi:hypothetical protein